ncbi:class I SAM-dependent methyltransferase [Candidatus Uhrbacteria bacterium]|nr:class I SAM-dependent methyltransferase [Candidatus Uhrbacteria bacterium]
MSMHDVLLGWWGRLHVGEQIRNRGVRRVLVRAMRPGMRILDAGCGRGENARWVARRWPSVHVDAVDMDAAVTERLQRRCGGDAHAAAVMVMTQDIAEIPTDARYGIVYTVDVLEHVPNPAVVLQRFASVLLPGGWCIIHVPALPQRRWMRRFASYAQEDHVREGFVPHDLTALLHAAGFVAVETRMTFGPLGSLAWELFQTFQAIARPLVIVMYPFLWVLMMLDGGISWSRGNGVLVIARKPSSL